MREVSGRGWTKRGWICVLLLWVSRCPLTAQAVPDASVEAGLRSLQARAGTAFVGEVAAVRRLGGVVEVDFTVERPVKGQLGAHYVLREWGGLWAAGQQRYWVGERALVFLQEPGPQGLSSPVDGMEGVLPVSPASSSEATGAEIDVRRLRTRVVRAAGAPLGEAEAHIAVDAVAEMLRDRAPKRPVVLPPRRALRPAEPGQLRRPLPNTEVGVGYDLQ